MQLVTARHSSALCNFFSTSANVEPDGAEVLPIVRRRFYRKKIAGEKKNMHFGLAYLRCLAYFPLCEDLQCSEGTI